MSYKTPLAVYILWHPDYVHGRQIAKSLYSTLCRDSEKPLVRALGIPVYFRSALPEGERQPIPIDFTASEYTAVLPLISDEFVNDRDFSSYLEDLYQICSQEKSKRRMYPIQVSKNSFNVSKVLAPINFIRTPPYRGCEGERSEFITKHIKSPILHELCRMLMNMKRGSEETDSLTLAPPVKLFISHSKHDEAKSDAIKFRDYINSQTQLKTFFDANDIAFGSDFGDEIKRAASESALVVFQSDSYSDREWCRIEVLTAKAAGCPIVIVNAVKTGEKRAFPYLGNHPSIRLNDNYQSIIDLTLEQVLFNKFTRNSLDSLTDLYNIKTDRILSNAPELFNFIQLKKDKSRAVDKYVLVVYPDPPLGSEEMNLLNELDDDFVFITPIMLPSISKRNEQKI